MSSHRHTAAPPELSHGSAQPESSSAQDASSSLSAAPSIDERPVANPDQAQSVATAIGPPQPEDGPDEDPRTALMYMVLDQLKVIKSRLDSVEQGEHSPPSAQDPQQPPPPTPLPPVDPPSPSAASKGKTRVVPEEVKTRNATAVQTPPHVTGIPPHLEMMEDPDPIEAFACMPQGEKDSFRFMLRRFGINPTVLIGMLQGKPSSASGPSVSQPTSLTKSSTLDPPPRSSTPLADRARALPATKVVADTPSLTLSTVDSSGRVPHCRPEYLGNFNGQAEELEAFIKKVNSVARSNPDPAWHMAVPRR
ncbi:unnamed protein product [Tilletia caries]|nr:unnamed protein product [Tilletia caries]